MNPTPPASMAFCTLTTAAAPVYSGGDTGAEGAGGAGDAGGPGGPTTVLCMVVGFPASFVLVTTMTLVTGVGCT